MSFKPDLSIIGKVTEGGNRDFIIAFLVPAMVLVTVSLVMLEDYGVDALAWLNRTANLGLSGLGFLLAGLAASVLLALFLVLANSWIVRRKEGYGFGRRLGSLLGWWERRKFRVQSRRIEAGLKNGEDVRFLKFKLAAFFPPREDLLLPNAFGNAMRAFEAYPRVVYGFEATRGWSRLQAVIPKDYRELIDAAKAQVDGFVNLWFISWLFVAEYLLLAAWSGRFASYWYLLAGFLGTRLTGRWARGAAVRWGEVVKGAFDVYLPELRRRLELSPPVSREAQRRMWSSFSDVFLTRDPAALPEIIEPSSVAGGSRLPENLQPLAGRRHAKARFHPGGVSFPRPGLRRRHTQPRHTSTLQPPSPG